MKKNKFLYLKSIVFIMFTFLLSSCLKGNLDDLPAFEDAEITDIKFDFRYKDMNDLWIDGEPIVKVVNLSVVDKKINSETGTITCRVKVPAAKDSFTEAIRQSVSLKVLVGKCNISTAATVSPLEGSPKLGTPGDFSTPRKYKLTAANGSTKEWTITVSEVLF